MYKKYICVLTDLFHIVVVHAHDYSYHTIYSDYIYNKVC